MAARGCRLVLAPQREHTVSGPVPVLGQTVGGGGHSCARATGELLGQEQPAVCRSEAELVTRGLEARKRLRDHFSQALFEGAGRCRECLIGEMIQPQLQLVELSTGDARSVRCLA